MVSIKRGIKHLVTNRSLFCDSIVRNFLSFLPDKLYISLRYRCIMGHWIDWSNPKLFSEKLQWLKVFNRRPYYPKMVDKSSVKQYVASIIGSEYIIPTLGVWDKAEEIEWEKLPDQFVLKTTHGGGGGGVVICTDKYRLDRQTAVAKLNKSLNQDIYTLFREWPYKKVPRCIIAEQFIAPVKLTEKCSNEQDELFDYKFFCFNGKVKFFKVDFGRFVDHHANYYSSAGELLDFGEAELLPDPNHRIILPNNLNDMIALAEKLSCQEPFLRVDFYNVNGKIYFGELTFYPASGMGKWTSEQVDEMIGSYLDISSLKNDF